MTELTAAEARRLLPARAETEAKWGFGRALLCCGSAAMPGAAVLSAAAALRSGVGLVALASVPAALAALPAAAPECILRPLPEGPDGTLDERGLHALLREGTRCTALLCGCGLGISDGTRALLRGLLGSYGGTLVLDADALGLLAEDPAPLLRVRGRVLLTPHARELARLCRTEGAGESEAAAFAARYGAHILCKTGTGAVLVGPDGPQWKLTAPNSGMAKGGSGDVLAGLACGLAAQGLAPGEAGALAAYLHASAGAIARRRHGRRAMLPRDVVAALGAAFTTLEKDDLAGQ